MSYSRRNFLKIAGVSAAGATMVAPLEAFYARVARGQVATGVGFGPLQPKLPVNADYLVNNPLGDLSGTPLLDLPPGFNYRVLSATGQQMAGGGGIIPGDHDGMAAFQGPDNTTILVRNHELSPGENKFGYTDGVAAPSSKRYSTGAIGGTTTLVVGPNREVIKEFGSLSGTIRNCAGGSTPWGSWISSEETFSTTLNGTKRHGYNFEVPATAEPAFADPTPLVEMGRFSHEAVAVDPATGYVYETEDRGDSCFYRFVPSVGKPTKAGDLAKGGTLYALKVKGRPTLNTTNNPNLPAPGLGGAIGTVAVGEVLDVEWVKIDDPDPATDTVRKEAQAKGAAIFFRGEGMWYGNGLVYFVATQGGPPAVDSTRGNGQVWAYNPQRETVTLVVEASPSGELLDEPDNITVAPFGDLILCEDGGGDQFIVGVNSNGELYQFARNAFNTSEWAGACFSPDGQTLFVNNQSLCTYAIWGPWPRNRR